MTPFAIDSIDSTESSNNGSPVQLNTLLMKLIMKLHTKHQRLCLLRPLDLNDLAGVGAGAVTVAGTTVLAVLLLFRVSIGHRVPRYVSEGGYPTRMGLF